MDKKYEILINDSTDDTIEKQVVYRIKALKGFEINGKCVTVGDLGGYVESENNLSQEDNCWVEGNVYVYGNAKISGNAHISTDSEHVDLEIYEDAKISGNVCIIGDGAISGNSIITDNVKIDGSVDLKDDTIIKDNVNIDVGEIETSGKNTIQDNTVLNCDTIELLGDVIIKDKTKMTDDAYLKNLTISGEAHIDAEVDIRIPGDEIQVIDFDIKNDSINITHAFTKVFKLDNFTAIKTPDGKIMINDGDEVDAELNVYLELFKMAIDNGLA